jgi:threonine dehydrogenase-like Zn-dependent dehydrogenase
MSGPSARAFWTVRPGAGEIREETLPELGAGQVRVRTLFSAVSRGTESLVFRGLVPESEYARMRCPHQRGDFPGPVKYGYSNVGQVVEGPEPLLGRAVFCLYPHQTEYVVAVTDVVPLPPGLPPERAVLGANLETALNAFWDARPLFGERITVVGAGALGCLCAYLAARLPGAEVELCDVRASRRTIAEALGVEFALPDAAQGERDLVIHTSASAEGLQTALRLAARERQILELSWYGARTVTLALGGDFHVRRLTLRSSQVGSVSPNAAARWTYSERLALALRLAQDPRLDRLINEQSAFEALPETLARLSAPEADAICHRVDYGS